ncbi:MAG: hypothetical protein MHPSP_003992, partial [Paramarteilia canceri]
NSAYSARRKYIKDDGLKNKIVQLKSDINFRKDKLKKLVMKNIGLFATTLTGFELKILEGLGSCTNNQFFDYVIIDEGSQALFPSAILPIFSAKRLIVAGDINQLQPTIFLN